MHCTSFPVACMRVPVAPYPHLLFSVSYAPGCVRGSPVALICFSLMTNPLKHPFMCLLAIPLHIFFGEMSVKTFANICKYFLSVAYLFIFLTMSFEEERFYVLVKFGLLISFFFYIYAFCVVFSFT